jgi:hypothetical protein
MKNLLSAFLLIFSTILVTACNDEMSEISQETQSIEEHNKQITTSFREDLNNASSRIATANITSQNFDNENVKALFIEHFKNYKIEVDGVVYTLEELENFSSEDMYFYVLEKLEGFENHSSLQKASRTNEVSREEIKDAMMKECAEYGMILKEACQSAVMIAYYLG